MKLIVAHFRALLLVRGSQATSQELVFEKGMSTVQVALAHPETER